MSSRGNVILKYGRMVGRMVGKVVCRMVGRMLCRMVGRMVDSWSDSLIHHTSFDFQKIAEGWRENNHETFTTKAIYYSLRGVICRIPENRRSKFIKSEEAFHIRVSNNGYLWSNPVLTLGHDSLCKNCTSVGRCVTKVSRPNFGLT